VFVGDDPRIFALRRGATDESPKLVFRDGWDGADRVLVDPKTRNERGSHVTVEYAFPSPDGHYVAYGVSSGGSENATIEIIEVDSGRVLAERIDRARQPIISWGPDSRSFFYWRKAKPRTGENRLTYSRMAPRFSIIWVTTRIQPGR
jgi:prolyl oligopeptidase